MTRPRWTRALAVLAVSACVTVGVPAVSATAVVPDGTEFYVPRPTHYSDAQRQIAHLRAGGDAETAAGIREMIRTPQAVWFTKGTPETVEQEVRKTVQRASARGTVPVLVAYDIPFRDCAQYSAGGATSVQEYTDWIDGFARGIGDGEAVVILEPDGLGIIPWYTTIDGVTEWCQPAEADAATAAAERFQMLNYAVDALGALPGTHVYLDGTHSAWLSVGDVADRLVRAGVQRADGFFLNVSNYQATERQVKYGEWISRCIHYGTNAAEGGWRLGHFEQCASQYYPASPDDFSTWHLTDQWYEQNVTQAAGAPAGPEDLAHFVVDTSRNGQGPWTPPAGVYPDPQDWCNPPGRGLGLRPTTDTGSELADAFLWIKTPGESDGECTRGLAGPEDPEWGVVDPPAGQWFAPQAAELVRLAVPPIGG